jgi:VanZ family protein
MTLLPFQNTTLGALMFQQATRLDAAMFNWMKFVEHALFWSVWGYLTAVCYHLYWRRRWTGALLLVAIGFLPGFILEFAQIFIVSRYSDINDILSNWLGVIVGMVVYLICLPFHRVSHAEPWQRLNGAALLYLLFILYIGLKPFDFQFSASGPLQAINRKTLTPFYAYFQNTNLWNLYDLINSILYFVPISLYLSARWLRRQYGWGRIMLLASFLGFLLGLLIEGFQLYSPTRVGEITDALSYGLGGFLGAFCLYYIFQEILPSLEYDTEILDLTGSGPLPLDG